MIYPNYIDNVPSIKLIDPLSKFLGVFENGEVEFSYLDIVKSAGHSCPTIAGAYLMCLEGLKALYKETLPLRGDILISFPKDSIDGVTGVVANVMTHITGATENSGFKGINGNFSRVGLIKFNEDIKTDIKMTRLDTNESVEIVYDPSSIPMEAMQKKLMAKILQKNATQDEEILFKQMWQKRVEDIFENIDKVISIKTFKGNLWE